MKTEIQLSTPTNVMTSPVGKALELTLFKSTEGIESLGVTTYEGIMTFRELAQHFQVEANSDVLCEAQKKQRDVDSTRVNALKRYWEQSESPVFPNMTLFSNELTLLSNHVLGSKKLIIASIAPAADRFIGDGQGRATFIKWLLEQPNSEKFYEHTISFKLIVTHTETLSDPIAAKTIKQVFSSYHVSLKKPNKSISKYFDTSSPLAQLLNELLEIEIGQEEIVQDRIALHGRLKQGHLWTFDQFTSMIQKFLNLTPVNANKHLNDVDNYEAALSICTSFLNRVFTIIPVTNLDTPNHTEIHDTAIYTKAIFANALGYVGRSLFEEMLIDESLTWDALSAITLPIESKFDRYWQKSRVTMDDAGAIKIIKGTDRRIGALICRELRIFPCIELAA